MDQAGITLKNYRNNADLSAKIKYLEFQITASAAPQAWSTHYYQDFDISSRIPGGYTVVAATLSGMTNGGCLGIAMQSEKTARLISDNNFSGCIVRVGLLMAKL